MILRNRLFSESPICKDQVSRLSALACVLDFIEPRPSLQRNDEQDLLKKILELTQREAKQLAGALLGLRSCSMSTEAPVAITLWFVQ